MNFIGNIVNLVLSVTLQLKTLLLALGGAGLLIGGMIQAVGGQDGSQKAKKWYFGATIGIVVGLCSKGIVDFIQSLINF